MMPENMKVKGFLLTVGLPVLLFCLTYGVFGFYYETNDDQLITFLLRGITIKPALNNLSLYFHGWSWCLAQLYQWLPAVPWYGLFLYTGLLGATILAFFLVYRAAAKRVSYTYLALVLILFYLSGWLEHVMWFNYMRVPFLGAGITYLWLVTAPSNKKSKVRSLLAGLIFLASLAIRPSAALMGVAMVGPVFLFFSSGKGLKIKAFWPALFFGGMALAFLLILRLNQTPAIKTYQQLDWLKSTIIDFQIYQAQPANHADSLGLTAIDNWLLADTKLINADFYQRAGSINPTYMLTTLAPKKLMELVIILLRDQFLALALNGILLFYLFFRHTNLTAFTRMVLGWYQVYFWLIIILVSIFLKLPPRLITPALSLYTLTHLVLLFRQQAVHKINFKLPKLVAVGLGLLVILQLYKTSHRAYLQQRRQQLHEAFIADVKSSFYNKILVSAVFPDYLRSLSPFRNYDFGNNRVFLLTGWSTLDPGYQNYFYSFSGQPQYAPTVAALARNANAVWLLYPDFQSFLNQYFTFFYKNSLYLQPKPHRLNKYYPLQVYLSGKGN